MTSGRCHSPAVRPCRSPGTAASSDRNRLTANSCTTRRRGTTLARRLSNEIWRMPVEGGDETLVVPGIKSYRNFAVGRRGVYYAAQRVRPGLDPGTRSRHRAQQARPRALQADRAGPEPLAGRALPALLTDGRRGQRADAGGQLPLTFDCACPFTAPAAVRLPGAAARGLRPARPFASLSPSSLRENRDGAMILPPSPRGSASARVLTAYSFSRRR